LPKPTFAQLFWAGVVIVVLCFVLAGVASGLVALNADAFQDLKTHAFQGLDGSFGALIGLVTGKLAQ
jgi:hypothetical protein